MPAFPEDVALARRMADRDGHAWEEAARRFTPLIASGVRGVWGRAAEDAISDATEEVFLELLQREGAALRAYEGRAPLGAYLLVVTRRVALRLREADRRHRLDQGQLEALSRRLGPEAGPGFGEEEAADLGRAIAELPARQQRALHALYARGLSPREAGRELGCTAKVVATLAWRGRGRLRKLMEKQDRAR